MSRTELYQVKINGDVEWVADFRNSHGSAMMIWNALHREYFGRDFPLGDVPQDFWDLQSSPRLQWYETNSFLSTFDLVIVRASDLRLMSASFLAFADRYQQDGRACSLRDQASTLDRFGLPGEGLQDTAGVCWNQTSVNCNPWQVDSICATCGNPDDGEARPWNINKDTNHWFADLKAKT